MTRYQLRVNDAIKALLPWFMRKPKIAAYIESICKPVKDKNDELEDLAEDSLYRVAITGQVIYLERLLNDLFDNTLRRIYITDFSDQAQVYLYLRSEGDVTFAYRREDEEDLFMYSTSEILESYRFAINIPEALYDSLTDDDIQAMRANTDMHKTAGTTYVIVKIT